MLIKENKVQYGNQRGKHGRNRQVPKINLQGVWLEKFNFNHTDNVKITATNGKIIIEKVKRPMC